MASDRDVSETSPLLGSLNKSSTNDQNRTIAGDEGLNPVTDESSERDLEQRLPADESRDAQFQGVPEIQQRLKYILPALSIGVRLTNFRIGQ